MTIDFADVAGFGGAEIQVPPDSFFIILRKGSPSQVRLEAELADFAERLNQAFKEEHPELYSADTNNPNIPNA